MSKNSATWLLALLCAFFAQTASAFIDPPYLTPAQPLGGQTVSVNIRGGVCDGIGTIPGYPQITQEGNAIRIVLWSVSYTDPILCNIPIGTATYAVGAFAPGAYTLQMDRDYQGDLGEILTETLGVLPFTVVGGASPPVSAPTLGGPGLLVLFLAVLGMAYRGWTAMFSPYW